MKTRTYGFENIRVASPCHELWDNMTGDEKVRFCGACERPVYNLSGLTGRQIAELIRGAEGQRRCVRFYRRTDGTILTRDCPVGHRNARRKAVGVFASAIAAIIGGSALFGENIDDIEYVDMSEITMGVMEIPEIRTQPDDEVVMGEMIVPEEMAIIEQQPAFQQKPADR